MSDWLIFVMVTAYAASLVIDWMELRATGDCRLLSLSIMAHELLIFVIIALVA